jgi:hypothetical protein
MAVEAKQIPNAGPAVLLACVGLGMCLLLVVLVAAVMIMPSVGSWAPSLPSFQPPPPQLHQRAAINSLQAAPSELATISASEAVDRALGRPVVRHAIALPAGPVPLRSPDVPRQEPAAAGAAAVAGPAGATAHQVLPPPPGASEPAPVFAVEYAFFLDPDAATQFSAALAGRGLPARLVEQRDEAGRNWIYVRSQVFSDAAMALVFAAKVEQNFGLSALLVTEPAPVPAAKGAPS